MQSSKQLTRLRLYVLFVSVLLGSLQAGADPNAYVVNTTDDLVTVIDTTSDAVVATIAVGDAPTRVAITQDGARAYVTNTGGNSVSVIDTATDTVVATVAVAEGPSAVAVTPDGSEVYVVTAGGVLQVIDADLIGTASNPVIETIPFGAPGVNQKGTSIAILPDGTRAYAVISGFLRVVDTTTLTVESSLDVGTSPSQVAISPDGTRAYVTNAFGMAEFGPSGQVIGFGANIAVVDTQTDSVLDTISFFSSVPAAIAITPDGTRAYVASVARFWNSGYGMGFLSDNHVFVIDLTANVVSSSILVAGTPGGVALTPDGSLVYVAIPGADAISVIETATDTVVTTIAVAAGPDGMATADAPEPVAMTGDANGDGTVDSADYSSWADGFGMENPAGPSDGDFNRDGVVDGADFTIWADTFSASAGGGQGAGDAPAPEASATTGGGGGAGGTAPEATATTGGGGSSDVAASATEATAPACGLGFELIFLLPSLIWLRRWRCNR